jgi:hypothetical protein
MMIINQRNLNLSQGFIPTTFTELVAFASNERGRCDQLTITNTETALTAGAIAWEVAIDLAGTGAGSANAYYKGLLAPQRFVNVPLNGHSLEFPSKVWIKSGTVDKLVCVATFTYFTLR